MPNPKPDRPNAAPSALQWGLSVLLLALFAPIVLAVGSPALRPAWLLHRVAGIPLSLVWVVVSIAVFIGLTWTFSKIVFAQMREGEEL